MIMKKFLVSLFFFGLCVSARADKGAITSPPGELELRRSLMVKSIQRCAPAVINISAKKHVTRKHPFWGLYEGTPSSIGSGVIFHPAGFAITNAHVIQGFRDEDIKVLLLDKRELGANVLTVDRLNDLAILKINGNGPFPVLKFGTSSDLMVGEKVIAMGNPFGYEHTVSDGVISALHRSLAESALKNVIQTNASINPGNSGGPLLNIAGRLIGINTAIRREAQNIGFAIPVDRVRESLCFSLDPKTLTRTEVGVEVAGGPRVDQVRVTKVTAKNIDVRPGDLIIAVEGQPCRLSVYWNIELLAKGPGSTLNVLLQRGGNKFAVKLPVLKAPKHEPNAIISNQLGLEVQPLYSSLTRQGLKGVLIASVRAGGPAGKMGIIANEIIETIGISGTSFSISTPRQLADLLKRVKTGKTVELNLMRLYRSGPWIKIQKRTVKLTVQFRKSAKPREEI